MTFEEQVVSGCDRITARSYATHEPSSMIQFILTFPFASTARAGGVPLGGACSTDKLHLDPSTHRLVGSDCGHDGVCSNNTCVTKGCRRDEYPFGFHLDSNETLPPMCIDGLTFCPDDEDSCRSLVELGQTCELNRDGMIHVCFLNGYY